MKILATLFDVSLCAVFGLIVVTVLIIMSPLLAPFLAFDLISRRLRKKSHGSCLHTR